VLKHLYDGFAGISVKHETEPDVPPKDNSAKGYPKIVLAVVL
jgi:hypothetical protein